LEFGTGFIWLLSRDHPAVKLLIKITTGTSYRCTFGISIVPGLTRSVLEGWAFSNRKLRTDRKICVSRELFLELIPLDRIVFSGNSGKT
jgi:hypothetical protein